ncbi:hypothetical protein AC578_3970 [Pseudocercospora eumusae]|uniref:Uncharacterized protein n=1 Tax=Pseudocercospora eumusae TaxID=321146 RepID=A0A139HLX9_9PEZI|nr:hypothetical protein AC578_3970 [Pseudocercospora eumusae]
MNQKLLYSYMQSLNVDAEFDVGCVESIELTDVLDNTDELKLCEAEELGLVELLELVDAFELVEALKLVAALELSVHDGLFEYRTRELDLTYSESELLFTADDVEAPAPVSEASDELMEEAVMLPVGCSLLFDLLLLAPMIELDMSSELTWLPPSVVLAELGLVCQLVALVEDPEEVEADGDGIDAVAAEDDADPESDVLHVPKESLDTELVQPETEVRIEHVVSRSLLEEA